MKEESLKEMFRRMLRIRMIEERIAAEYPGEEMRCPVHLSIGQEAAAVGVCSAMRRTDLIVSTHRAHAHYLAKGGGLKPFLAELFGKSDGCAGGKGGSMHLVSDEAGVLGATPIVGGSLPVAVGAAFGTWLSGGDAVTAVFFGEGATEEGVFHEAINFAALKGLPVVFVCENNLYSVYSPLSVRQGPERDRVGIARANGLAAASGDGNDPEEVRRIAGSAIERARSGGGPSFIELETYRWREHCGPNFDNDIGYRSEEEFLAWKAKCPIASSEKKLRAAGELDDEELGGMKAGINSEIDEAFEFAKESPFPEPSALAEGVYAEAPDGR